MENREAAQAVSPNVSLNQPPLRKPRDLDKEMAVRIKKQFNIQKQKYERTVIK